MKIVSWNIAHRDEPWRWLLDMDADIALLQEARPPPTDVAGRVEIDSADWATAGPQPSRRWRTAIVRLSDRVTVEWIEGMPIMEARDGNLPVSVPGTIAAAHVTPSDGEALIVASMYAQWLKPHSSTGSGWIFADASAHQVISDLSVFIGQQSTHRLLAAGDMNILHGYGEHGSSYWASRYGSVFARMEALGLAFVGPQAPHGRQADPWPSELPSDSKNVPTFRTNSQAPAAATRQLDYAFASNSLAEMVSVRALNEPDEWGPSDHCRLEIEVY